MFDLDSPVSRKTFIAFFLVAAQMKEGVGYVVERQLELHPTRELGPREASRIYANTILAGERPRDAIARILRDEFGITRWRFGSVVKEEMAKDDDGSDVPRVYVTVFVDPAEAIEGRQVQGLFCHWTIAVTPLTEAQAREIMRWKEIFVATSLKAAGIAFDGTPESLRALDAYISDEWKGAVPESRTLTGIQQTFGAYLGDILVRCLGGRWVLAGDGGAVVEIRARGQQHLANVFGKVGKRFKNGPEDSLAYFFHAVKKTCEEGLPEQKTS